MDARLEAGPIYIYISCIYLYIVYLGSTQHTFNIKGEENSTIWQRRKDRERMGLWFRKKVREIEPKERNIEMERDRERWRQRDRERWRDI